MLARRWRGIRVAIVFYVVLTAVSAGLWAVTRWERVAFFAAAMVVIGAWDAAVRTLRTLRLRGVARHPEWVQPVRVIRLYRRRHRIPDLEVAGLWPEGADTSAEPPFSVRVEDVSGLPEGGEVLAYGRLVPGRYVLLVHDDEIVWPLRRIRRGLHPRKLGPYPFKDADEDEDDD